MVLGGQSVVGSGMVCVFAVFVPQLQAFGPCRIIGRFEWFSGVMGRKWLARLRKPEFMTNDVMMNLLSLELPFVLFFPSTYAIVLSTGAQVF